LRCFLAVLVVLAGAPTGAAPAPRPNIVFIMTDDHAAHAMSCYGSRIHKTPQLDRLAKEGMRFANCFVTNSICTPSRAAILTGKYSHLNGVTVFNRFDGSQTTFPKLLQAAGYQTALIGKWHLESDPTGFDYWNVLPGQGLYHDPEFIDMGVRKKLKGYATDIITDRCLEFLARRDKTRPFLLLYHHKAPHREWSPDSKHAQLYEDADIPLPATFHDAYHGRSRAAAEAAMRVERDLTKRDLKREPPEGLSVEDLKVWKYQRYIKDYLRCVASVDDNVGRFLDALDAQGLTQDTVVVYTSDQGFFLGEHGWYDKRFMYEESLRMPLLVRYPQLVHAGAVNERMALNVDFAPTLLELAGVPVPAEMQGRSLVPLLRGDEPPDWRRSMYYRYYHYPQHHRVQPHYGVRSERHKLIYFHLLNQWELFDLEDDPEETRNVYADPSYARVGQDLKAELERLRRELKDDDSYLGPVSWAPQHRYPSALLALRFDFEDAERERVRNAAGKGHDGTLRRGEVVDVDAGAAGKAKRAVKLAGDGAIEVKADKDLDPSGRALAVGAWCRPEAAEGVIAALGGGAQGFSLFLKDGVPHFAVRSDGELHLVKGPQALKTGAWVHVAGALTQGGALELRVQGEKVAEAEGGFIAGQPSDGLSAGADTGSRAGDYESALGWRGLLADLRLYWGEVDAAAMKEWLGR
jgi:arylsulfatase A-like enzyme